MTEPRIRAFLSGLLVLIVSLVLFLVSGELLVRLYLLSHTVYDVEMARYARSLKMESDNPQIGHVHRPRRRVELMGVVVETNSDGLRDREYPAAKGRAERIVFLGDSVTLGWGVAKGSTFEALLESRLNQIRPTEILNFGVGNFNTEQQVALFLEKGLKYDPDGVVVFYFINDAEPLPKSSWWSLLGHSRLCTFIWSRSKALLAKAVPSMSFESYYRSLYREDSPGWLAAQAAFRRLGGVCRDRSIRLQVVIVPELHDLESYPFTEAHAKVTALLDRLGIQHLDLRRRFPRVRETHRLWVALDDAHPNAEAHRLIAHHSLQFLLGGSVEHQESR